MKEIFDKTWELKADPQYMIFNQFEEMGNQPGRQTAEGSAYLVAAGREPLARHGNDAAGHAGELGGDLHIVGHPST